MMKEEQEEQVGETAQNSPFEEENPKEFE
jgi:hypothetical protein